MEIGTAWGMGIEGSSRRGVRDGIVSLNVLEYCVRVLELEDTARENSQDVKKTSLLNRRKEIYFTFGRKLALCLPA